MNKLSRRRFLRDSGHVATSFALALTTGSCGVRNEQPSQYMGRKALIVDKPAEHVLSEVRKAGFGGVEAGIVTPTEAEQARKVAERVGVRIHSVMRGWAKFNSTDPAELESSLAVTVDALKAAQAYGADSILLVPGRIAGPAMPEPWQFRVEFDQESGYLTSVAEGDNTPFQQYIAEHNRAWDSFRAAVARLIPEAQKRGVVIAVENVWNNLFVDAAHFARFIDSFESPCVKAYFDIGNHVKYSEPQHWISVLGKRIFKCHVKDFKLNNDGRGGRFVNIREGSVNWPIVMQALNDVGYNGWMTIEGSDKLSMQERSSRLELILEGN